jgi:hypothetical protein
MRTPGILMTKRHAGAVALSKWIQLCSISPFVVGQASSLPLAGQSSAVARVRSSGPVRQARGSPGQSHAGGLRSYLWDAPPDEILRNFPSAFRKVRL